MKVFILLASVKFLVHVLASSDYPEVLTVGDSHEGPFSPVTMISSGVSRIDSLDLIDYSPYLKEPFSGSKRNAQEAELIDAVESDHDEAPSKITKMVATCAEASCSVLTEELMDIKALADKIPIMTLKEIRAQLTALGQDVMLPIKDDCNWNLLHEAVYTDNCNVAQMLLTEFHFDPNAFDLFFGSAVYLIQSKKMAVLLRDNGANLNDQRSCSLYSSAVDSARLRGKMALVSMVEPFQPRLAQLHNSLASTQSSNSAIKFEGKRENMFDLALAIYSRRRCASCASIEVVFRDELGKDLGGLSVELIDCLKNEFIKRESVLVQDNTGYYCIRPDPIVTTKEQAVKESEELNLIKFLGFIVGLSIFHKVPLGIEFTPILYEIMCGMNPDRDINMISILKETDQDYYNSLRRLAELDEVDIVDYSFPEFERDNIRLWKQERGPLRNKNDLRSYFSLAAKERVYTRYQRSFKEFKAGVDSAIKSKLIYSYITPEELKTVIKGETDYTAADWRAACKPPSHATKYNQQYEWFWKAVDEISPVQRALLLKFVTARVALPADKFEKLSHQPSVLIIDDPKEIDNLPKSSTCFNQIRLYPVSSYERMKKVLIIAGEFFSSGFGNL